MADKPLKSSHQPIPLATKGAIIKAVDSKKKSKSLIAQEFGVAKSTVSTIIKNKEKTLEALESLSYLPERKRLRRAAHTDIEEALLLWFKQARSLNVPSYSTDEKEADKSLSVLKRYIESRDPVIIGDHCLPFVSTLERAIANDMNCASIQTKITPEIE